MPFFAVIAHKTCGVLNIDGTEKFIRYDSIAQINWFMKVYATDIKFNDMIIINLINFKIPPLVVS